MGLGVHSHETPSFNPWKYLLTYLTDVVDLGGQILVKEPVERDCVGSYVWSKGTPDKERIPITK